jgi:hypothetical protein
MTIIVLAMVPLVFQGVERLIFHAPPRSPTPHELIDRAFLDAEVGDPAQVLDLVPVPLPALQEVDPKVHIGLIERQIIDKPTQMAQPCLGVISIVIRDASSVLGRRDVLEQGRMVPFFDTKNIMQVVSLQTLDRGSVRTQAVFGDDHLEVGVVLAQVRDEAFGGMALTIVFLGAVLRDDRLGHQRNDCALIGVHERGAQHLVTRGDSAMAGVPLSTRRTVHLVGGNRARTIEGSEGVAFHTHHRFQRFAALEGAQDVRE